MFSRSIGLFSRSGAIASIAFFTTFQILPLHAVYPLARLPRLTTEESMALEVVNEEKGFYKSTTAGLYCLNCTIFMKILQQHYVRSLEPRRFLKELTFFENEIFEN